MHKLSKIGLPLLALIIGCGGQEPDGNPMQPVGQKQGQGEVLTNTTKQALRDTHQVDEGGFNLALTVGDLLIQSIVAASQATNSQQPVLTGTIDATDPNNATYSPEPTNELILKAKPFTLAWSQINAQGDFSDGLEGDHSLNFQVRINNLGALYVDSVRQGTDSQVIMRGPLQIGETAFDADLKYLGTIYTEVDTSGSEHRYAYQLTGTLAAAGMRADLDESWKFEIITTRGDGASQSAQSTDKRLNHRLEVAGTNFTWNDVYMAKRFRDGKPSQLDTEWTAQGTIKRGGQDFGTYSMKPVATTDSSGYVSFLLTVGAESFELERVLVQ